MNRKWCHFLKLREMKHFYLVLFSIFFIPSSPGLYSQCSSGNPSQNAPYWNFNKSIGENYNAARRWEEGNRNLTPNCLGNMTPPSNGWNSLNYDELVLYIHNSERAARGLDPVYGVQKELDNVSQLHSDWMLANGVFSHTGDPAFGTTRTYKSCNSGCVDQNGSFFADRIKSETILNNYQWAGENIASTSRSLSKAVIAERVYAFIYRDLSSDWGHRENILLNYTDNWGDSGSEGFIGVGVSEGSNYHRCGSCSSNSHRTLLTVDYYDPKSFAPGYTFNTTYSDIESAALPIEFVDFYSKKMPEQVELSWVTASEENCDYFVVQRSTDMKEFEDLCDVEALRNSNDIKEYSYIDENPLAGTNYYRLKYYDNDGRYQLSDVVSEHFYVDLAKIFPNPFKDRFNIEGLDVADKYSIEVLDVNGRVVYNLDFAAGNSTMEIDLSGYNTGLYFVNIKGGYIEKTYKILKY